MAAKSATDRQQMLSALGEATEESETRTKAPEAWQAYVKKVQEEGPLDAFRVEREGFLVGRYRGFVLAHHLMNPPGGGLSERVRWINR